MSKERPILFSGPMVKAILDGRKTQTRRVVKPKPYFVGGRGDEGDLSCYATKYGDPKGIDDELNWADFLKGYGHLFPYGQPGDRLWVRETYAIATGNGQYPVYRADAIEDDSGEREGFWIGDNFYSYESGRRWFPSIHMPKAVCRLKLEITGVRVERLQDISFEDAKAEGVGTLDEYFELRDKRMPLHCHAFAHLWDSLADKATNWDANPWVWVIEFKRMEQC